MAVTGKAAARGAGPGRPTKMQVCPYCGDELGLASLNSAERADLCCADPTCKREKARAEQMHGEYIEGGERVR